jgi:hypothetical protein
VASFVRGRRVARRTRAARASVVRHRAHLLRPVQLQVQWLAGRGAWSREEMTDLASGVGAWRGRRHGGGAGSASRAGEGPETDPSQQPQVSRRSERPRWSRAALDSLTCTALQRATLVFRDESRVGLHAQRIHQRHRRASPNPPQSRKRPPLVCVCSLNDKLRQRVLGYSSTSTPTSIPSIVAEPETTSVAFPAVGSQQRAPRTGRQAAADGAPPSLSLSPPGADSDQSGDELPDQDEQDEDTFDLPSVRITGSGASASASSARKQPCAAAAAGLLPPPSTTKVVKAPKGRVRVEKGFSQLDWAKLNRSGEVDLRVSSFRPSFLPRLVIHCGSIAPLAPPACLVSLRR